MKFLANENFPLDAVEMLRQSGHDVTWIRSDAPGSTDEQVLALAVAEQRILLTQDKDFGDLAFHSGLPTGCGVVLFRFRSTSAAHFATLVSAAISSQPNWTGNFSVVEPGRIRVRPLPNPGAP